MIISFSADPDSKSWCARTCTSVLHYNIPEFVRIWRKALQRKDAWVNIAVGSPSPDGSAVVTSVSAVMAAPSALQPPLTALHLIFPFLPVSAISFNVSTSLIRLTWENCCLAALWQFLCSLFLFSLFCSAVTCDSSMLDLLPSTTTCTSLKTLRGSRRGLWCATSHTVMQYKGVSLSVQGQLYSLFQKCSTQV